MRKYSYSEETKNKVIAQYMNGVAINDIIQNSSLSLNTVYRILRRNNIKRDRFVIGTELSEEDKKRFVDSYINSNYCPFIITENYNNCKYKNEANYFDNINNQDKAYILGLLYADGNINKNGYVCSLTLQERDKELLEKIYKILYPIASLTFVKSRNIKWQNCYKITISSKRMCDALIYHGVIPNKSLKLQFPKLSYYLYKDFFRGYYDGDGTLYVNRHGGHASFISSIDFCKEAKFFLLNELGINSTLTIISDNEITTRLQIGGYNQIMTFLNWLYNDAHLYLKRKYNSYCDMDSLLSA